MDSKIAFLPICAEKPRGDLQGAWCLRNSRDPEISWIVPGTGAAPELGAHGLHLWGGRLAPGATPEDVADHAGFSLAERHRLAQIRRAEDRAGYAGAHAALRLALSELLRRAPGDLVIQHTRSGAPELAGERTPRFSLSHAGELGAIALANHDVGVDIDVIPWMPDLLEVADHFFAPANRDHLRALAPAERSNAFARYWTMSEAFVKATGSGFPSTWPAGFATEGTPRIVEVAPAFGVAKDWRIGIF